MGRALRGGARAWAVAGLMALMVLTHFLALAQAATAYMIAVKRTSILFGILLGAWVFREAAPGCSARPAWPGISPPAA